MSSRIDWKNYDYSEGPPKAPSPTNIPRSSASVGSNQTRDTNPYSKSFTIRRSSPTHDYESVSHASLSQYSQASAEVSRITGQSKLTYRPSTSVPSPTFANSVSPVVTGFMKPPKIVEKTDSYGDIPLNTNVKKSITPKQERTQMEEEEDFNEVWDQAESEWKEAESVQRVISDDEGDVEDGHFIGAGNLVNVGKINTLSPPVGILRNKSDPPSPAMVTLDEEGSYSSSKRRKHPWDKDYGDETNDEKDAPMDERSLDFNADEEDDSTDLQEYEANEKDVADMEDDDAVVLKHEQYKMQQQLLQQKQMRQQQQQKLFQHPYGNDLNADAIESMNRRRTSRKTENELMDEDDSIAQVYGNLNEDVAVGMLQDRAKQAWSKRNQATAVNAPVGKSTLSTTIAPRSSPIQGKDSKRSLVSFQKDTVHEFEPDEEQEEEDSYESEEATEYTEDDTQYDDDTYAERSMHSVYTKSYESEAEDLVKDLFLWGSGKATNPGRRELKYKNEYKEKYKQTKKKAVQDNDEGTIEDEHTFGDESTLEGSLLISKNDKQVSSPRYDDDGTYDGSKATYESLTYSEMGEDAWAMTYNYCEDLLTMIGSVCGIRSVTASKVESEPKQIPVTTVTTPEKKEETDIQATLESWIGYAAELLFDTEVRVNVSFSSIILHTVINHLMREFIIFNSPRII